MRLIVLTTLTFILYITGLSEYVHAQQSQTLSVTPPLFQLSVAPGDVWQSSIKVVNPNGYDLPVYADIVNFEPLGEEGQGRFIPVLKNAAGATLAEWITISPGPYIIKPEQSREINFIIEVPEDASPGGHFAAVLIGTRPPEDGNEPLVVQTSQAVTSLFFARIEGDIIEAANIREFSIEKKFVGTPESEFLLRFENKGNVHLRPQGEIKIYNMWGKERGVIPINQESYFGNVLPDSIRAFHFSWKGEQSISEIGRHTAKAALTFGSDARQNVSAATHFWVIPVRATLITVGSIAVFIAFIIFMVRLYVRRMLTLAGVDVESPYRPSHQRVEADTNDVRIKPYRSMTAPIRAGASDFRNRMKNVHAFVDFLKTVYEFIIGYKTFFGAVIVTVGALIIGGIFLSNALVENKSYEITIKQNGETEVVDSEQVIKEKLQSSIPEVNNMQQFALELINASGKAGVAAETGLLLEDNGYRIDNLRTDFESERARTVVVFDPLLIEEAKLLSGILGGALLSGRATTSLDVGEYGIQIYVGKDIE